MLDNKDSRSGGKSNTNRSHGKYDSFNVPTSSLENVVFQPHSSAAHFKKNNNRLADHVRVTFIQMGPTMVKTMRKLVQPFLAVTSIPDSK